jgi:hypothetical protein
MKEAWGTIVSVTGDGFELSRNHEPAWFRIGMDLVVEGGDLRHLFDRQVEVTVQYDDIPDENSHVALRVFPSGKPRFAWQA